MADSVCSSSLRMLSWVVKVVPQPPEPKKSEEQKDAAPPPAPAPPPAAAPPPVTVSFAQLKMFYCVMFTEHCEAEWIVCLNNSNFCAVLETTSLCGTATL